MGRYFNKALKDLSENRMLNAVAVITVALSFLIVSAFGLFFINADALINSWKKGIRIMAYLAPEADADRVATLRQALSSLYGVKEVAFIDKAEALEEFRRQLQGQQSLLENLKENPLPHAFEIRLTPGPRAGNDLAPLVAQIQALEGISDVEYGQQWMQRISSVLNLFRFAGMAMGGLFFMAAVFIVANTIRLILYTRREEVEIMRLVGATDRFIKTPFYIEGLIQGLAGALLGLGTLFVAYLVVTANIGQDQFGSDFEVRFFSLGVGCLIILSSMLIGWIGCHLSLKQFLR